MKMREYLSQHMIVGTFLPEYICVDAIVDNPEEFIDVVNANGYYISETIMWDRVASGMGSKIGYGDPADPRAATEYYFSETFLSKTFQSTDCPDAYLHFISECMAKYPDHDLFPSFTVVCK
jgi:hypothetical protein